MPRKYTLRQRWADYRAEARANRPKGMKARVQAWLHVEPFYWGMRAAYVILFVGAVFAVYINGVANGWWHAWGDKPTVTATTPAARPTPSASSSTEAAMSGGYQIGPDGVLVRPAEHAASTYTKPEQNMTEPGEKFREGHIKNVNALYANGWMYGNTTTVTNIVSVLPASEKEWGVEPNTIAVVFDGTTNNGIACVGQRIIDKNSDEAVTYAFFMTWKNGGWISTGGSVLNNEQK